VTITSQPAADDIPTLEVVIEHAPFDIRYVPRTTGHLWWKVTEYWVELRHAKFFGPNDVVVEFTEDEWIEFCEQARRRVRDKEGGVKVGDLYFTRGEWDLFLVCVRRGLVALRPGTRVSQ
jgi:hypothetical protein